MGSSDITDEQLIADQKKQSVDHVLANCEDCTDICDVCQQIGKIENNTLNEM